MPIGTDGDGWDDLGDDGRLAWYGCKIDLDSVNAALLTSRGTLLKAMGRIDDAMDDFDRARSSLTRRTSAPWLAALSATC